MMEDPSTQFLVFRNLAVILIEHHCAVRVARDDVLYSRAPKRFDEFCGKLEKKIFISGTPRRLTATSFTRQHSPGNSGRIQNLFHRQGDRLAMRIETQSAAEPEQPFLFSVENRKLIRGDQFLPRILGNAPRIVRSALHGRKQLNHFLVRDAALAYESPAQVENFSSHMFDSDRTHVLARAAG